MEVVSNQRDPAAPASGRARNGAPHSPGSKVTRVAMFVLVVVVLGIVVIWGISSRRQTNAQLSVETHDQAIPTVSDKHPKARAHQQEIVLPGDMQPFTDAPIFCTHQRLLEKVVCGYWRKCKKG